LKITTEFSYNALKHLSQRKQLI